MKEKIREDMKNAMRAKDSERVTVLRGLLASFTNELVAQKRPPTDTLSEDDILKVIKRAVKQRRDSIEQFTNGNRNDLAEKEQRELEIIEKYLPEQISEEEIKEIVVSKINELGVNGDKSKLGIIIGAVMKELSGNADGNIVKNIVINEL